MMKVSNLVKVFPCTKAATETCAVDGLDFSIAPGQTYGLLGPNGAGKTTTLAAQTFKRENPLTSM